MGQRIDSDLTDGVALIRPRSEDLGPEEAEAFTAAVTAALAEKPKGVVVDFSFVNYMSSIFLSALIEKFKELRAAGIRFVLAELGTKNLEILRATKLDTLFTIYPSAHEAVMALRGS